MRSVKLTKNFEALVDDDIFDSISVFKWCISSNGYAVRGVGDRKNNHIVFMHHIILPKKIGFDVDHINRNKLDNRLINLRYVTRGQNMLNTGLRSTNTNGLKGTYFIRSGKRKKRWVSKIKINYKEKILGYFHTQEEAHQAYKNEVIKYV